jgi:opacity protein-like surface antigen
MKKISVIVLIFVSFMFAAYAEAATPKRRTRNMNRIGPYGGVLVGAARYTGDQSGVEGDLLDFLNGAQNVSVETEESDIGYQAAFGFRFHRYIAAELALAQFGDLSSTGRADINNGAGGTVPETLKLTFSVGGPVISAVGILPLNEKFEFYGRVGVLFASSDREITQRVDGETIGFGSSKGDSTEMVLGLGASWNINQMYSIRAEFQKIDGIGDPNKTGNEDLQVAALGLIIRF